MAPLFVAGLLARLGVAEVGHAFEWLASTPALVLFGVATVVEMVADKVPALDHALDTISTFIRPVAGAIVAAAVLVRIEDPLIAVVVGMLVGAPVALAPHAAKASARVVSSGTTAGVANPVISTIEDVLAIVIAVLAFVVPILLVVAMLAFAILFVRWLRRRGQRAGQARA
ncbi:DUF4126 domain-containing protein [Sandaracinus amylolyticus]|uniref:DUF4126 domain-containing protein n=1 Tax=Sandaracinus amylolyticus TaxID=927083 RepID=UPI001F3AC57A|nr:DUF4126 domain-containing protein [Sandaracinus amylolyticus]